MIAHLVLGALALLAPARGDQALAPDGRPGLGGESSLSELLGTFRSPDAGQEELLRGLTELQSRMGVLAATTRAEYQEWGYFDALDRRTEATLENLHGAFQAVLAAPEAALVRKGPERRAWARMLLDPRFRLRMHVLDGWRRDDGAVTSGLAVLRANTDGWTRLREDEAQNAATRVDLAAAFLRARCYDLQALREDLSSPPISDEDAEPLLAVLDLPPGPERVARLAALLAPVRDQVAGMEDVLFTTRLQRDAITWVQWRDVRDVHAAEKRAEVRVWQPQTAEGKEAPREIERVKKTTRRREAYRRALEGLSYDPTDEEMAYAAAVMARYIAGTLEALSYYDRFLALRGIRVHDSRTWGKTPLSDEEEDAIFFIQQYEAENPPGTMPPSSMPPSSGQ